MTHDAQERLSSSAGRGEDGSLAELLCAISFATSIGLGDRIEHGLRSAYVGLRMADALGLSPDDREAVFYGALLKDSGCTACGSVIAAFFPGRRVPDLGMMMSNEPPVRRLLGMLRYVPLDQLLLVRLARFTAFLAQCQPLMREAVAGHCEVAELFARRLGFSDNVQRAVRYQWERWDGAGAAYRLRGQDAPVAARVLHVAQVGEFAHSLGGASAAERMAREQAGKRFDPDLVSTFCTLSRDDDFWAILDAADAQERILGLAPATQSSLAEEDRADAVCEALADLIDSKAARRGHSRRVAETAARAGLAAGLREDDQARLRRAALVHDLGIVALPSGLLVGDRQLSRAEQEQYRRHPYFTSMVLGQVRGLRELGPDASAHHERPDGSGYHRQLSGDRISASARLLTVADRFEELRSRYGDDVLAFRELRSVAGSEIDAEAFEVLLSSEGSASAIPEARHKSALPSALTERELEVLRLLARGLNNPEIAQELVISRKTVEHHIEHIFNKVGVSSRSAAAAYAVHQALF